MKDKTTSELEHILQKTRPEEIGGYLAENEAALLGGRRPFSAFMHQTLKRHGLTQQEVFLRADISERYGYKLLSEEKRTRQRDYILRICYAANMDLNETQTALKLYGMSPLYARVPRDAALMIAFNQHRGDILWVNSLLEGYGMEPLKASGDVE